MTKQRRDKKDVVLFITVTFLLVISIFVSLEKFNTSNPFSSGIGLIKIMATDTGITQIEKNPQVYLVKPDNAFETLLYFMKYKGYEYLEEERLSSTLVFKKETSRTYVDFSVNDYYSKWVIRN